MSVTLHFQSTGTVPGNAQPFRMLGGSLTLGRSDVNDLVLPDPDKMISGRHCAIEDQDGNLVVIDLSTNGTFLNYGKMALGKTPTPLNNGDILSIGPYELLVEIAAKQAAPLADPLPEERVRFGVETDMSDFTDPLSDTGGVGGKDDFLDGLLGGDAAGPSSVKRDQLGDDGLMPPLDDDGDDFLNPRLDTSGPAQSERGSAMSDMMPTPAPATSAIPDDWDLELELPGPVDAAVPTELIPFDDADPFALEPEPTPPASAPPEKATAAPPNAAPTLPAETPQTRVPQHAAVEGDTPPAAPEPAPVDTTPKPAATPSAPIQASAPASRGDTAAARAFLESFGAADLNISDADLPETMARLGDVMNTMVAGIRSILMTRQSIKSEFRINQTVISAGANNPLKFSVSVDQAIEAIARPTTKGYLPAKEAAQQAMDDIAAHEVAMMTGMEAALKGVLEELNPKILAERISKDKGLVSVLTNKKARYWDVFETQYEKISDQAENDFHDLFSKAFAQAYQAQLERLKK